MPTCASGSMRSRARPARAVPARCWSAARWSRNTRSAAPARRPALPDILPRHAGVAHRLHPASRPPPGRAAHALRPLDLPDPVRRDLRGDRTHRDAVFARRLAAVLGNTVNYAVGRAIGPPAFSGRYRLLKVEYLRYTEGFFRRYGGMAVLLSRFMPIIRTCAPFVAGIARMPFARFLAYNLAGGVAWVILFVWGGYLFGNIPLVKAHFGLVTIGIIGVSLLPFVSVLLRRAVHSPLNRGHA